MKNCFYKNVQFCFLNYFKLINIKSGFIAILIALVLGNIEVNAQATAPAVQPLPYSQNFSTLATGSSTYPVGWQGYIISSNPGISFPINAPISDSSLITNSNASNSTGGIHNYNQKIGILDDNSTDQSLCLGINTTGSFNITVKFDIMTIRNPHNGTTNTRIVQVDLQYRANNITSTWTSVSGFATGIYQNNTTSQINGTSPQNILNFSKVLPAACDNQAKVYLRWVVRDFTGIGAYPSFAIDNIDVPSCTPVTPSVTIASSSNPACDSSSVTFTPTPTNGGNTPTYKWFINGITQGSSSTFTSSSLVNGDTITCIMTSSASCATSSTVNSNAIIQGINPLPTASISTPITPICSGSDAIFNLTGNINSTIIYTLNGVVQPSIFTNSLGTATVTIPSVSTTQTLNLVSIKNSCLKSFSSPLPTASITILPLPTANAGSDTTVCGSANFQIGSAVIAGNTSLWSPSSNLDDPNLDRPLFTFVNSNSIPITKTYTLTITNSTTTCKNTDQITITINPIPTINAISDTTICAGTSFSKTLTGNLGTAASYHWSNSNTTVGLGAFGTDSIGFIATNNTLSPITSSIKDTAIFTNNVTCKGGVGAFNITVNPIPAFLNSLPTPICSGVPINFNISSSITGSNVTYSWTTPTSIPNISGNNSQNPKADSIFNDILINSTNNLPFNVPYTFSLTFTNNGVSCTNSQNDSIKVNPLAPPPIIMSTTALDSLAPTTLCNGSENVSFNILNANPLFSYSWSATPSQVLIKDITAQNTVVSFYDGHYTSASVMAFAYNTLALGGCKSIASSNNSIQISFLDTTTFKEANIILQQPGNLLVYLDNTVNGFQWGYDSISNKFPVLLTGQIYQALIPPGGLDTTKFWYWVIVFKNGCSTKVYFNGDYKQKRFGDNVSISKDVISSVIPNPNSGNFDVKISGDIYGYIDARIYNTLGQNVFTEQLLKREQIENYPFKIRGLPLGIYLLEITSSKDEKYVSKIIIQ